MKIFIAGAAGIVGQQLIPLLVAAGHTVTGTTRQAAKAEEIQRLGATPAIVDVYNREQLTSSMQETQPDLVIHQLTDLSSRDFAANSRLRKEGTRNLVDAAKAVGVQKLIAQSIAWAYAPGSGLADEETPLDTDAPPPRSDMVAGVQALEEISAEMPHWVVLRYGLFYGPGTWYAPDGLMADEARKGKLVADESITSFLHIQDAARATVLALDWPQGYVNVVDDEPAPGTAWLPIFAESVGAPPPPTKSGQDRAARGATNARARQQLRWQPLYPGWRQGFMAKG